MTKRNIYFLDDMEEIAVLLLRIEHYKFLTLYGYITDQSGERKIRRAMARIEKLGGNTEAKVTIGVR